MALARLHVATPHTQPVDKHLRATGSTQLQLPGQGSRPLRTACTHSACHTAQLNTCGLKAENDPRIQPTVWCAASLADEQHPAPPTPSRPQDFFGRPSYLTVSGQLQGEYFASGLSNIYTFGPTFRAENSHTSRHLAEFWMIEPEMAFCDLQVWGRKRGGSAA